MNPRVLSVWLPNWPIQRLLAADNNQASCPQHAQHAQPERLPKVLVSRDPRRGLRVVACCRRAAAIGIKQGMSGNEADSLIKAATGGRVGTQQHDGQADYEALQALAHQCALQFSPLVALEPLGNRRWAGQLLHMPQGLLMDVSGIGPLFQGEQRLCHAVDQFFRKRNLQPRLALACTLAAAWGLSRTDASRTDASRTERSTGQQPRYLITSPDTEFHHLVGLPIRMMRLEPRTVETLARLGVHQFGQLLRLPRTGLATRFDQQLILRIDQLLGNVTEPLPAYHHQALDRTQADLEHPTRDRDILEHQIKSLAAALTRRLSKRDLGALQVVCQLELLKHDPIDLQIGLYTPSVDAEHLLRLLMTLLQRQRLPADVHRVSLQAQLTGPLQQRQLELIAGTNNHAAAPRALGDLIDTLSGRLGRHAVLGVRGLKNPQPEDAYRLQPLTGQPIGHIRPPAKGSRRSAAASARGLTTANGRRRRPSSARTSHRSPHQHVLSEPGEQHHLTPSPHDPLRRPTTLFPEPIALGAIQTQTGHPPQQFRYNNMPIRTHRFWGPERIETAWWSGASVRRDYYRIETHQGDWLWIFRKLSTDDWFVHGVFD